MYVQFNNSLLLQVSGIFQIFFQFDELKNLATCRRLAEVDFDGNPLTKQNRYRDNVIINVAELVRLDGKDSFQKSC